MSLNTLSSTRPSGGRGRPIRNHGHRAAREQFAISKLRHAAGLTLQANFVGTPTWLAEAHTDAGYFERNLPAIEVLIEKPGLQDPGDWP